MRVLVPVLVGVCLASWACDQGACPRDPWCEGDEVVSCRLVCSGGGTGKGGGLPTSCTRKVERLDCSRYGLDTFGVAKTCHSFRNDKAEFVQCVDQTLTACTKRGEPFKGFSSTPVSCGPGDSMVVCAGTSTESFLNTQACFSPRQACIAISGPVPVNCVDAPRLPCDPSIFPRCSDSRTAKTCIGTVDAGFFVLTDDCGSSPQVQCAERDGGASCVFFPSDAGP